MESGLDSFIPISLVFSAKPLISYTPGFDCTVGYIPLQIPPLVHGDDGEGSLLSYQSNNPFIPPSIPPLSQVSPPRLLAFDGFEQGLEIALAEAAAPLALDDFIEQGGAILHRLGEDLQQVAVLVAIDQDAIFS